MIRSRKSAASLKAVKELDAFPKVPDNYTVTTASGGTISILSFILILILIISEIYNYSASNVKFNYDIDSDFDSKIKINLDITVAMPCDSVGADILDVTKQTSEIHGVLKEEEAYFELSKSQRVYWDTMQKLNQYVREQYHSVQEVLWKEGYVGLIRDFSSGRSKIDENDSIPPDACRLYGTLTVNKVSGNLHIIAGKHIPHPAGHAHVSMFLRDQDYNFSHRIESFSFGEPHRGLFDPLEGDEKITQNNFHLYQYYIKVVPTEVKMQGSRVNTFQYSVTEQDRAINHGADSHGIPGIYFKYDLSPVKVKVLEENVPLWHLLVRICGIVGGIFATSGLLNYLVSFAVDLISCHYLKANKASQQFLEPNLHSGLINTPSMLGDEYLNTTSAFNIQTPISFIQTNPNNATSQNTM